MLFKQNPDVSTALENSLKRALDKDDGNNTIEENLINNKENKQNLYQLNSDAYRALYHKLNKANKKEDTKEALLGVFSEQPRYVRVVYSQDLFPQSLF